MPTKILINIFIESEVEFEDFMKMLEKYMPRLTWNSGDLPTEYSPYRASRYVSENDSVLIVIYDDMTMFCDKFLSGEREDSSNEITFYQKGFILTEDAPGESLYYGLAYNKTVHDREFKDIIPI